MWTLLDAVSKPSPPPKNRFQRSGFLVVDFSALSGTIRFVFLFFQTLKKSNQMSARTRHYHDAVEKIHHKLIQEEFKIPETKTFKFPRPKSIQARDTILIVSMKLTELKQETRDEFYKIPERQPEHNDSTMECFHAGGGYEIEEVPSSCNGRFDVDDEDCRFGDPTSIFEKRLEAFGTIVGESVKLFFPKCEKRTKRAEKAIPAHIALHHF